MTSSTTPHRRGYLAPGTPTLTVPSVISFRCPICMHEGAFHGIENCFDIYWLVSTVPRHADAFNAGMRVCPNRECGALVFIVAKNGKLWRSYPPETIDFDVTNLPPPIVATLEEAIKCHAAECHKATALMVRRLLEELCADKNAKGADLKARLTSLGSVIVIPKELLVAADQLRILGNDAAHIEAKEYDAIGRDEAGLSIELAKELLKAVYQYGSLVDRLKALKKPDATPAKP